MLVPSRSHALLDYGMAHLSVSVALQLHDRTSTGFFYRGSALPPLPPSATSSGSEKSLSGHYPDKNSYQRPEMVV